MLFSPNIYLLTKKETSVVYSKHKHPQRRSLHANVTWPGYSDGSAFVMAVHAKDNVKNRNHERRPLKNN